MPAVDDPVVENDKGDSGQGWVPVAGAGDPLERIEFDNLDFVADVTHPVRGRIYRAMKEPRTIAEVAALLDAPVTRLYHHVQRLEDSGLIRVVATRQVGSVTERRFHVVAKGLGIAQEFIESSDPAEAAAALGSLFDFAKVGLQREVELGTFLQDRDDDSSIISLGDMRLSPERRKELVVRLSAVVEDFVSEEFESADDASEGEDDDAVQMTLFVAAYPQST